MANKITQVIFNCEQCGKEHSHFKSQYAKNKYHFCCKECAALWRHGENNPAFNSIKYNCDECNKEFLLPMCETTQRDNHFCSQECSAKHNGRKKIGVFNILKFEYNCDNCGELLMLSQLDLDRNTTHYCGIECRKEGVLKLNIFSVENNGNYKGGDVSVICNECGKSIITSQGHYRFNIENGNGLFYCDNKCFGKYQKILWDNGTHQLIGKQFNLKGSESSNWKDDYTRISRNIRNSPENYNWKKACLDRDNHKCVICGSTEKIVVHHKIPLAAYIKKYNLTSQEDAKTCEGIYDVDNGVTLCKEHQHQFHTLYGKDYFTPDDFKEYLYNLKIAI